MRLLLVNVVDVVHLTTADFILLAALIAVAPAYSYLTGRRLARGYVPKRIPAYVRTMASWLLVTATMLFLWIRLDRPLADLGIAVPFDVRAFAGLVLCALVIAYINGQMRVIGRMDAAKRARVAWAFGQTAAILPRTLAEYRWFLALSLTAGCCEELLYRGYLFAVAAPYVTVAGALFGGAIVFGLGHAYQGPRGILKTAIAGALFGAVYLLTGSILWPMLLHALVDVQGGTVGYRILRDERASV